MSVKFFDGWDWEGGNSIGPGGRKWDQGSSGFISSPGRFGGQCFQTYGGLTGGYAPATVTFSTSTSELIVGQALNWQSFPAPQKPFLAFYDHATPQVSLWLDPSTFTITVRTGLGNQLTDFTLGDSGFVPPLTLWFYLECKMTIGNPGGCVLRVNGTNILTLSGVQTQQSGNPTTNKFAIAAMQAFSGGHFVDDLYVIDTQDGIGNTSFLGEVRVQTKYPDANGYRNDFTSSGGANYTNVNAATTSFTETGHFNYSGTVGAIDSYSIGNFTITGTIFAVQTNLSFRKDDVGNRAIRPLMRTSGSINYTGAAFPCFSDYTYAGAMWENNPDNNLPWILTDLNAAEFGITVDS